MGQHERRAKRINKRAGPDTGVVTPEDLIEILAVWGEECFYCGEPITFGAEGSGSFDHLIPFARGGRNTKRNCVPCCLACNRRKADKWVYLRNGLLVFRHHKPDRGW